jgi:hypothetical protein
MFRRSSQHLAQSTLGPQSDLKRKIGGFLTEFDALGVSLCKSRNIGNLFEVSDAPRCGERMTRGPELHEDFIVGFGHNYFGGARCIGLTWRGWVPSIASVIVIFLLPSKINIAP